jgi:protein-disulfide isomerase
MTRRVMIFAAGAALLLAGCNKAADKSEGKTGGAAIAAPAGTKWTETTSKTPEGGMLMGNPAAPVKLIEYGALTCSHCADFSKESSEKLRALVAKGTVSYEFRNFLLSVIDVPAAVLARCGGPGPFFPIAEQLYVDQAKWLGATSTITQQDQDQWKSLPPELLATVIADKLGLVTFVRERGIGAEKAKACLLDKAGIAELETMQKTAIDQFKVSGTPTFIINGLVVPETTTWEKLEPALKAAGA